MRLFRDDPGKLEQLAVTAWAWAQAPSRYCIRPTRLHNFASPDALEDAWTQGLLRALHEPPEVGPNSTNRAARRPRRDRRAGVVCAPTTSRRRGVLTVLARSKARGDASYVACLAVH